MEFEVLESVSEDVKIENEVIENNNVANGEELPELSTLDMLLNADLSKFKVPSKKIEISRLSEVLGRPFIIELRMLNATMTEKIEKKYFSLSFDEDGNPDIDADSENQIVETLVEACYTEDGKQLFKNANLRRKFNCQSNNDLCKKILLQGERKKLYDRYKNMCGFIKTSINDIKN